MVTYRIKIAQSALETLKAIKDQRVQGKIREAIEGLKTDPEKKGKPLWRDLAGFRTLRAVGQRYRIVYKVERHIVTVTVIAVGIRKDGDRKDIYDLARKLVRLGLA